MRRFLTAVAALQLAAGLLAQTTTSSSSRTIHTVAVGANNHAFTPNTTRAAVGDIVVFDFYPTNHSVIRGEYTNASICGVAGCNPCVPWELYHTDEDYQGFFSGNQLVNSFGDRTQWNLTVNNTEPIWFYCDALDSCTPNGMVGVINPQNGSSWDLQHTTAMDAVYQLAPGQPWPAEGSQPASSSSGHHSSSLSGGAIAGIVVGSVAFVAIVAALFFFIARSRTYSKFFKHAQSQPPMSEVGDHHSSAPPGSLPPWSDHTPSRMGSPPPPMPGSPPIGSEKAANPARWSDSTAYMPHQQQQQQQQQQRFGSPPPQENMMFVGYNRQTGAPEFAPELPGDHEIHQVGSPEGAAAPPQQAQSGRDDARVIGSSPVEMDANAARSEDRPKGAPPP